MALDGSTRLRAVADRFGARASLAVTLALVLAGCGGSSGPAGGGGSGNGGGGGGGGAVITDACSLLTATDIQNVVGHAVATSSPFQDQPGQPGCSWSWPSDTGNDNVSLTVVSPGGRADFDSTRAFDLKFAGGLSSLGAAAASEAAPISSGLAEGLGNIFQVGDVAGLGDAAFMGPGVTIYAVKGDTEIQIQLLDVTDTPIPDKTIQLAKIVLGRL